MRDAAYYNEFNPHAAQWLRNLIAAGHIAPGVVDERSIEDVHPSDLAGFAQCHFFAGVGVWSLALRRAGWPDSRPVWTGSCPCQPFSTAGKGDGFDDERHLWPAFHHLIRKRRPAVVFGEQVAGKDADAWIDLVQTDMEALDYPFGAVPFPSAGVGAPHIRDRIYWVADSMRRGAEPAARNCHRQKGAAHGKHWDSERASPPFGRGGSPGIVEDAGSQRLEREPVRIQRRGPLQDCPEAPGRGETSELGDPQRHGLRSGRGAVADVANEPGHGAIPAHTMAAAGPVNGLWRDADWLLCRDGKWRSVEPGTFPLASGAPARVGRLCAYGNAINAEAARIFIEAVTEAA